MPRKKGVSLKRNCLQRSAPDAMDLLDKDNPAQQIDEHQGKEDGDNDFSIVEVASPEAGLAQAIKSLEEERDFLRQTVLKLSNRGAKKKVKKILDSSTECSTSGTDEESLSSCSSSESSDSNIPRKRKKGHKKKTKSATRSNTKHSSRATTPEDVLKRYNKVLHAFKKEGSISKACTKVGVDRNTLALTAVVAEIQLVDPEFYRSISKFRVKEEKLCDFAKRCLQSLTADLRSDIEKSKKERKLLPIKYKLR
ncbi:unnamed protein product [Leuciscus chuanchicus]